MPRPHAAIALFCLAGLLAASLTGAPPPAAAQAPPPASALPITNVDDMYVDEARGFILVSEGRSADGLAVLSLGGKFVGRIPGIAGPSGITPVAGGSMVDVGALRGREIVTLDLDTLQVTRRPVQGCPSEVIRALGMFWYSSACGPRAGALWGYDPVTGANRNALIGGPFHVLADPSRPDGLYVATYGSNRPTLRRLHIDPLAAEPHVVVDEVREVLPPARMAFSPDGGLLYTAGGQVLDPSTLASIASVRSAAQGDSGVAVRHDGLLALSTDDEFASHPDVTLYRPGNRGPFRTYELDGTASDRVKPGLQFGDRFLYVITDGPPSTYYGPGYPVLRVLVPEPRSKLDARTTRRTYRAGDRATFIVRVSGPTRERTVRASAQAPHEPPRLRTLRLNANGVGRLTLTVRRATTVDFELFDNGDRLLAIALARVPKRTRSS